MTNPETAIGRPWTACPAELGWVPLPGGGYVREHYHAEYVRVWARTNSAHSRLPEWMDNDMIFYAVHLLAAPLLAATLQQQS